VILISGLAKNNSGNVNILNAVFLILFSNGFRALDAKLSAQNSMFVQRAESLLVSLFPAPTSNRYDLFFYFDRKHKVNDCDQHLYLLMMMDHQQLQPLLQHVHQVHQVDHVQQQQQQQQTISHHRIWVAVHHPHRHLSTVVTVAVQLLV
jgi:hypothetical protein